MLRRLTALLAVTASLGVTLGAPACPAGLTELASFADERGAAFIACEDLQVRGGAIALVSATESVWLSKGYEPYTVKADSSYYLGLGKQAVLDAATDVLGAKLLCEEITWRSVEQAVPPIRRSGGGGAWCDHGHCAGVRTFVGSRSSSVDVTFSDIGEECSGNSPPSIQSLVINGTNRFLGENPVGDFSKYLLFSHLVNRRTALSEPSHRTY